jgi:alpha-tubulin suppressor-like RCC1 family protein
VVAPRRIGTGTGFQAVSAGNRHALAIGPGNVIYAWGFRESGGLGDGAITGLTTTPTMVTR